MGKVKLPHGDRAARAAVPLLRARFVAWRRVYDCDHRGHATTVLGWSTPAGLIFTKTHAQRRKYAQEKQAYLHWAPAVQAPRLLDYDETSRTLLMTAAPGVSGAKTTLPLHAHHLAGGWLRRLHGLEARDGDPISWLEALDRRLASLVARSRSALSGRQLERVTAPLRELMARETSVRRVCCHRDFDPRNWVYDGARLSVVDFEHARLDAAPWDLTRLKSVWWPEQPELEDAFFAGYGAPSATFAAWVAALSRMDGLATYLWGLEHGAAEFIERGRKTLGLE